MDIREILNALSEDDRALWSTHRTTMRKAYLNAHNNTIGVERWEATDDAFMDLIDIKLAILFDRGGKLFATKDIIGDGDKIEKAIRTIDDGMKEAYMKKNAIGSVVGGALDATEIANNGWITQQEQQPIVKS